MAICAKIYPHTAPTENCIRKEIKNDDAEDSPEITIFKKISISMYAIGSLLPLSNSRRGLRFSFNLIPFDLKIENTDAESVDDIIDASNIDSAIVRPGKPVNIVVIRYMSKPVKSVVKRTPSVESNIPGARTGRISLILVSNPPEKRIILKATFPIN